MRSRGVRRQDLDVQADPGVVGLLSLHTSSNYRQLSLQMPTSDGILTDLLPPLYEAVVINIRNGRMIFRGAQKEVNDERAATYLQEWLVEPVISAEH